jgi:hypothetical protein
MFYEEPNLPTDVRAVHVLCDASKRTATDKLLKALYNRLRPQDILLLPEGKFLKYVTSYANRGDRRPTQRRYAQIQMCRVRQAQFLDCHLTAQLMGILDLDLPLHLDEELGLVTLRQILLGVKTSSNWKWPLFVSVDHDDRRGGITALYHKDNAAEAATLISYLPIILDARYGSIVWNWFTAECRGELEGSVRFDDDTGQIVDLNQEEDDGLDNFFGGEQMAPWEIVNERDITSTGPTEVVLDLSQHFDLGPRCGGAGFDDAASLASLKTGTSNATVEALRTPEDMVIDSNVPSDNTSISALSEHAGSTASAPPALAASARQTGLAATNE